MSQSASDVIQAALYALGADKIAAGDTTSKMYVTLNARVDDVKKTLLRWHPWNFAVKRYLLEPTEVAIIGTIASGTEIKILTASTSGLATGDRVTIADVGGTAEANGTWVVGTVVANTSFVLNDSTFTNAWTSGGTWTKAGTFDYTYSIALPSDCLRVLRVNDSQVIPSHRVEGGRLLTDDFTNELKYVYNVTDYATMDPMFYMCLQHMLAWDVADRIAGADSGKKRELHNILFGGPGVKGILPSSRFVDATEDGLEQVRANEWIVSRGSMIGGWPGWL